MSFLPFHVTFGPFVGHLMSTVQRHLLAGLRGNLSKRVMKQDGKWGWCVVAATAFACSLYTASMRCFSAFYRPLMTDFDADYVTVSLVLGLFEIGYGLSCFVSPVFFKYLDYRTVVMGMGIASAFSIFLASYSTTLWQVQVACGLINGLCMGGVLVGTFTATARYFEKYIVLAMQISSLGSSLGGLAFCPLFQYFIDTYGWPGAWQLVAGVFLNAAVFGALVRPITLPSDKKSRNNKLHNKRRKSKSSLETSKLDEEQNVEILGPNAENSEQQPRQILELCRKWDLDLFISFDFYLYTFGWVTFAAAYHHALSFLVPFGKSIGFDGIAASTLPSAFAIGELLSRFIHAFVFIKAPKRFQYQIVAGILAISTVFYFSLPFTVSYYVVFILCGLIGLCLGGLDALYCVIIAKLFGLAKYASGFGYSNIFSHLLGMASTLLIGYAIDMTKNAATCFWIGGGSILLSSGILLVIDQRIKQKNF